MSISEEQMKNLQTIADSSDSVILKAETLRLLLSELRAKAEVSCVPDSFKSAHAAYVKLTNSVEFADNGEAAYVADVNMMLALDRLFDDLLAAAPSPTGLDNPEAPNLNDKYTFVFPDASMTKIRYIFVDGEMVYENLESEQ